MQNFIYKISFKGLRYIFLRPFFELIEINKKLTKFYITIISINYKNIDLITNLF